MSDSQSSSNVRRSRATLTKQACDACKTRKVKCIYDESAARTAATHRPCRRCSRLALNCTFSVPQKSRGPRRRRTDVSNTTSTTTPGETSRPHEDFSPNTNLDQSTHALTPHIRDTSRRVAQENHVLGRPVQSTNLSYLLNNDGTSTNAALLPTTTASLDHAGTYDPTSPLLTQRTYQTDSICSRELFKRIIGDYLDLVYPIIPVIHRPSFRQDFERERESYDSDFFLLLVGICALTLGIAASRFEQYRLLDPALPFQSPDAMINHCYDLCVCHREASYYDQISHQKWAVSYCLVVAFFQIGHHNRSRMLEIEAMQLARLLELHCATAYAGLDFIEAQLRRKAFWLIFYGFVHNKLQYARRERLLYLDCAMLRQIDFRALLPAEVEDEYITPEAILTRPTNADQANIVTAFNLHSKLFCTALIPLWRVSDSSPMDPSRADSDQCCGCECIEIKLQAQSLDDRFEELRFMLDRCPPRLQPWTPNCETATLDSANALVSNLQMEIVRANIHVTHLWLQCMILDRLDALHSNNPALPAPDRKAVWSRREDIARQMLHVLHSFSDEPLEPNGYHTFCKIRDVAVSLLNCPYDEGDRVAVRANEYLHRFTEILWRLDKSELLNSLSLQNWIDTGRHE